MTSNDTTATTTLDETQEPAVLFRETAEGKRLRRRVILTAIFLLTATALALGGVIAYGIHARVEAAAKLQWTTAQATIPIVSVISPTSTPPDEEIALPGNTQAFIDAPIYARTSGYLQHWYFDIGAHVQQGQMLAEIETPEIDQQLRQARADLQAAQVNLDLAQTTATRLQLLVKEAAVSKQETDQAVSTFNAQKATVEARAAEVHRLEKMQGFQKIYAPFAGVITARNTDIGALIDAGATTPSKELFHLASIDKLRVYVAVPEIYMRAAQPGATASLTLDEFPGQVFLGTLTRTANAIDPTSHTLRVEVDIDNPSGQLLPGAYVFVHLKLPQASRSVAVPANTLLFRSEGLRVAVVRDGRAELVPVTIGRDYGSTVEVVSGLRLDDVVIINPADSLISGTPVRFNERQAVATAQ
ncbi:MAG TPA: efflux RND transporter periplasmic adaptor subunit [Candidatus Binatia bacterium]|nr:efflux RND transporter periplasmic adaptor subunit [Candidatus Binatia bacterium]